MLENEGGFGGRAQAGAVQKETLIPPGFGLGTFCVSSRRDDHYTTQSHVTTTTALPRPNAAPRTAPRRTAGQGRAGWAPAPPAPHQIGRHAHFQMRKMRHSPYRGERLGAK